MDAMAAHLRGLWPDGGVGQSLEDALLGEALSDEWTVAGHKMGVARMHIAFNEAWISLYSSWNGAFCSNYGDLIYAKLYNPGVAGAYLDIDEHVYFFPRVCTLYVHLHVMVFSRLKTGRQDLHTFNWEDPALRAVWGASTGWPAASSNIRPKRPCRPPVDAAYANNAQAATAATSSFPRAPRLSPNSRCGRRQRTIRVCVQQIVNRWLRDACYTESTTRCNI